MTDWFSLAEFTALIQVVIIDVALAGDNAIVVGMAAAGLAADERRRAIVWGIVAATVLRIVFALFTTQLLQIVGLLFAGGILLLWVCWKLWRELRADHAAEAAALDGDEAVAGGDGSGGGNPLPLSPSREGRGDSNTAAPAAAAPTKTFRQAVTQIVVADVSMSLDNVLAVAGTARDHIEVLIVGLALSVALMGLAANFVARLLHRHRWIAYVGLLIILYVAIKMMWDGGHEIWAVAQPAS
ncbi:TerC family protein [Inquilinus limosus]|uniref:TerC family protein n=1 Tax=Inquilinus limosus TaxID=171674 RepID=UPI00041D1163|nr:TerC family protein [Inquilinus limosus]